MTYTYAILDVSPACYAEIAEKLEAACYSHCFHRDGDEVVIDMHGIALRSDNSLEIIRDSHKQEATNCPDAKRP